MEKEDIFMKMEIIMMENLKKIKNMGKENVMILMGIYYMKEILKMVFIIKEKKKKIKKMVRELIIIQIVKFAMKEILLIIIEKEEEYFIMKMVK